MPPKISCDESPTIHVKKAIISLFILSAMRVGFFLDEVVTWQQALIQNKIRSTELPSYLFATALKESYPRTSTLESQG